MDLKDLIERIKKDKKRSEDKLEYLKNNINSTYLLAKLDFIVVENINDEIEVFEDVIKKLDDLQKRIIERNRRG